METFINADGEWIIQDGVEMLIAPSPEWISKNQPVIILPTPEPTSEERLRALEDALIALLGLGG